MYTNDEKQNINNAPKYEVNMNNIKKLPKLKFNQEILPLYNANAQRKTKLKSMVKILKFVLEESNLPTFSFKRNPLI